MGFVLDVTRGERRKFHHDGLWMSLGVKGTYTRAIGYSCGGKGEGREGKGAPKKEVNSIASYTVKILIVDPNDAVN